MQQDMTLRHQFQRSSGLKPCLSMEESPWCVLAPSTRWKYTPISSQSLPVLQFQTTSIWACQGLYQILLAVFPEILIGDQRGHTIIRIALITYDTHMPSELAHGQKFCKRWAHKGTVKWNGYWKCVYLVWNEFWVDKACNNLLKVKNSFWFYSHQNERRLFY